MVCLDFRRVAPVTVISGPLSPSSRQRTTPALGAFPALRLSGRPHIYMAFVPIMHNRPFLCRIRVWPA